MARSLHSPYPYLMRRLSAASTKFPRDILYKGRPSYMKLISSLPRHKILYERFISIYSNTFSACIMVVICRYGQFYGRCLKSAPARCKYRSHLRGMRVMGTTNTCSNCNIVLYLHTLIFINNTGVSVTSQSALT